MYLLKIENMHCMSCVRSIEKLLRHYDPRTEVKGDLITKELKIRTSIPEDIVRYVIKDAGYKILTTF